MDYSVEAYLERQSTENLHSILRYCSADEEWQFYEDVIDIIQKILLKREREYETLPTG